MHISYYQELLDHQDKLNTEIGPHWIDADLNWGRALRQNVSVAIDSCAWKWWDKKSKLDLRGLFVDLADIFHFILSMQLSDPKRLSLEEFAAAVGQGYKTISANTLRSNFMLAVSVHSQASLPYTR